MKYTVVDSPVGLLTLVSGPDGLQAIRFGDAFRSGDDAPPGFVEDPGAHRSATAQLAEYFNGRRRVFDLRIAPAGTAFQRAVWDQLVRIPWGETRSYREIAGLVGRPGAARAVGMANNQNPIPIVIPCHRVIGADGSLTGYGGGIDLKARLLELEGAFPTKEQPATSHSRGRSTELAGAL